MKVLVTGASGQLGWDVCRELERREIEHKGVSSRDFDLTDPEAVRRYVMGYAPDAVIHCAAYTAVDKAEDEPERCQGVNTGGTQVIARCCQELGAKMLFISTDYVFSGSGESLYETNDPTGALNVYGRSKAEGEKAVRNTLERYFIVRISWMFGKNGNNFVKTMLRLGKKNPIMRITGDQFGSPTYTVDLAPLLCDMVTTEKYGTYHATNEGICTWAEFAQEIFDQAGMAVSVTPRPTLEYPSKAVRPYNSRMSKKSLDEAGFSRLPHWKDALRRYLEELKSESY